jgi:two-component system phosphate regulon response regulator PhoB
MKPAEPVPLIAIIDDEAAIRDALATLLKNHAFHVCMAASAREALDLITRERPDLILLDIVLDESTSGRESGLDVLRHIRTMPSFTPVIMLTSYTEWQVESLGLGAIAFVTKPWDAAALIGQIRATLNAVSQIRREAAAKTYVSVLQIRDIVIDTETYRVTRGGKDFDLTPLEFALLTFLARSPNREWTREELLGRVWGYEWVGYPRTVDRHVAALRRKLGLERDDLIETVHGSGYRLSP